MTEQKNSKIDGEAIPQILSITRETKVGVAQKYSAGLAVEKRRGNETNDNLAI